MHRYFTSIVIKVKWKKNNTLKCFYEPISLIMRKLYLIIGFLFVMLSNFAQDKSIYFDTLIVDINEKIQVNIATYENGWLNYYDDFNERINYFKK